MQGWSSYVSKKEFSIILTLFICSGICLALILVLKFSLGRTAKVAPVCQGKSSDARYSPWSRDWCIPSCMCWCLYSLRSKKWIFSLRFPGKLTTGAATVVIRKKILSGCSPRSLLQETDEWSLKSKILPVWQGRYCGVEEGGVSHRIFCSKRGCCMLTWIRLIFIGKMIDLTQIFAKKHESGLPSNPFTKISLLDVDVGSESDSKAGAPPPQRVFVCAHDKNFML